MTPESAASSRHKKIVGDFGEHLILYWLSKHGYECARIDHVGIDLIAVHPNSGERLGVSVKSRNKKTSVNVIENHGDLDKIRSACKAFGCEPYVAVVVDVDENRENKMYGFLTSLEYFLEKHPSNTKAWSISAKMLKSYRTDPEVKMFECDYQNIRWP